MIIDILCIGYIMLFIRLNEAMLVHVSTMNFMVTLDGTGTDSGQLS